jgi:hypothetical protein
MPREEVEGTKVCWSMRWRVDVTKGRCSEVLRGLEMFSVGGFTQAGSTSGFGGGAVIFCYVKTRAGEAAEAEWTVTGNQRS